MTRIVGLCLMFCGGLALTAAGTRLSAECTPGPVQYPARCYQGGEEPLKEHPAHPNCEPNGYMCVPAPGSVCGDFNGYGTPRHGTCIYHISGSNPPTCQAGVAPGTTVIHYWVGGCDWDAENVCSCVFVAQEEPPPLPAPFCKCTLITP
jgi:hypothetical protein